MISAIIIKVMVMKKISIKKDNNILVSNNLVDFFDPKEIYIPLILDGTLNIKSKTVKKGDLLFKSLTNNAFSSISGTLKKIVTLNKQKYLVITNNFKEELNKRKVKYQKGEIKDLIVKYYPRFNLVKTTNVLYFKAFSDDVYNANNYFIFKNNLDEILEVLDILREVYKYEEVRILLKENDSDNINYFANILGSYPFINISLLPDVYPLYNDVILEDILKEKINSLTVNESLNLVQAIFYHQPLLDCYLTVSGEIENPVVVKVKKGTLLKEVLDKLNINNKEGYINNVLQKKRNVLDVVVDENVSSVLFFDELRDVKPCISCGKCLSVCPRGCEPIFKKRMDKCISCGLCEYVCPSNLSLRRDK